MSVIGLYSIKGGVGKTVTAVNLAYLAAMEGNKTVLCDLDPQGSASVFLTINPDTGISSSQLSVKAKRLVKVRHKPFDLAAETCYANLSLLPADFSFRNLDLVLSKLKRSKKRIRRLLKPFKRKFQWIFLDCPPGISLVAENVFRAADILLVPVVPTPLSLRLYDDLIGFFVKEGLGTSKIVPFFSMVERRKKIHRESAEQFSKRAQRLCRSAIPYRCDVEKMGIRKKPLPAFAPSSPAASAFVGLWQEIKQLGGSQITPAL